MQTQLRPTEILSQEHRVIERVLDCLDVLAQRALKSNELDTRSAAEALEFLATFADACHHMKEENALFKRMEQRGIPSSVGPVAVMLHEHELGRSKIRAMRAALARCQKGEQAGREFAEPALEYVELLHEHIGKEDHVLFPLAEACFAEADRQAVLQAFEKAETVELGAGTHQKMLALADGLMERLGVSKEARPVSVSPHGCAHGGCGQH